MRRYMVFDIETIVDWDFVYKCETKFGESKQVCIDRFLNELREKLGLSDFSNPFVPVKYHVPVVVAFIALTEDGTYLTHKVISDFNTAYVAREFWRLFQSAQDNLGIDTFVSFNGSQFDMPAMEINGFRNGVPMGRWFNLHPRFATDNPRAPFNNSAHMDLYNILGRNNRVGGSLDYWAQVMDLPGKVCIDGGSVADLIAQGTEGLAQVADYCLADVLSTAAMLLHVLRSVGEIDVVQMPIRSCSDQMDSVLSAVVPHGIEDGCVQAWAASYKAIKKNRESEEDLHNDDYIPF